MIRKARSDKYMPLENFRRYLPYLFDEPPWTRIIFGP